MFCISLGVYAGDEQAKPKSKQTLEQQQMKYLDEFLHSISEEQRDELKKLQKNNPAKFKEKIQVMLEKYKDELNRNQKTIDDLVKKYHSAKSQEERERYLNAITKETEKEFYRRLNISKQRLLEMQRKLERLRSFYTRRENNAEKIINNRVKYLTRQKKDSGK
jgi:uncharacterized membrane-anchored protein YjiN (DUF445 family)